MSNNKGLSIRFVDTLGPRLDLLAIGAYARAVEVMEEGANEIEQYAKGNAPWEDQTGEARDGLTASVDQDKGLIELYLAHSVDYGVWLELIQDGRFATIMPTLEALGPELIRRAGGSMLGLRGFMP